MTESRLLPSREALLAIAGTLAIAVVFLSIAGVNPLRALSVLLQSTLGNRAGIYEILVRAMPLTLAGLGIAAAFRCGVYNIGGDGQFILGSIGTALIALFMPGLGLFCLPVAIVAGMIAGALFAGIAGVLRSRFDANEIIVTIMLNYVAFQILGWLLRGPLQESAHIFPRSNSFPAVARLPELISGSQLHAGICIVILAIIIMHVLMRYSTLGYQLAVVGESQRAAEYGGIKTRWTIVIALLISGALCGLAGAIEVTGVFYRLNENVAPGIGIMAIAVALLAQLRPLAVPLTALLFGFLTVGAGALQRQLAIPFPLVWILDALVIFAFLASGSYRRLHPDDR